MADKDSFRFKLLDIVKDNETCRTLIRELFTKEFLNELWLHDECEGFISGIFGAFFAVDSFYLMLQLNFG